jgi:hypothetical protein
MKNNKAFTLTNGGKAFFFTVTVVTCHIITGIERTEKISLLAELKRMLHPHVFLVVVTHFLFPPQIEIKEKNIKIYSRKKLEK